MQSWVGWGQWELVVTSCLLPRSRSIKLLCEEKKRLYAEIITAPSSLHPSCDILSETKGFGLVVKKLRNL